MKPKAEMYLGEMMKMTVNKKEEIVKDQYVIQEIRMVDQCPSIRFLEEALIYNKDENFDGVSTMMLGAIWIREQFLNPDDDIHEKEDEEADNFINIIRNVKMSKINSAFSY